MRLKILRFYLKKLFEKRKSSVIFLVLNSVMDLLLNLLKVYILKLFLDFVLYKKEFKNLILLSLVLFLISIFSRVIKSRLNTEKEIQEQIMMIEIVNKINKIPYHNLEDKKIKERRESAIFAIQNYGATYYIYEKISEFISSLITVISFVIILLKYHIIYIFFIFSCSMLIFILNSLLLKKKSILNNYSIKTNYEYGYYSEVICQKKYQISNRIYGYSNIINNYVYDLNERITRHFSKVRNTEANYFSAILIFEYIQKYISYLLPAIFLFKSKIDIPQFTILVNCGINVGEKFNSILNSYQEINNSLDYLKGFYELMIMEEVNEIGTIDYKNFKSLEFKNVSFKYPNTENFVIEDCSFSIKNGEKVAILGLNGTGKSTILKLLLKLYNNQEGEILVNKININEYNKSYLSNISVVFQDVRVFPLTLKENIIANSVINENKLENVLKKLNLHELFENKNIELENLYNSEIFENGVEFSGGEKQLITIARALYRNGDLVVLDEPSSALDPIMTDMIINKFKILMENHTTILVTHNLKLAKLCDKILVLDKSKKIKELNLNCIDEKILKDYLEKS